MIKVLFVNNNGGGFANREEIPSGTSLLQFCLDKVDGTFEASNWMIRVNKDVAPMDQILQDGDRVTLTPSKIEGASA